MEYWRTDAEICWCAYLHWKRPMPDKTPSCPEVLGWRIRVEIHLLLCGSSICPARFSCRGPQFAYLRLPLRHHTRLMALLPVVQSRLSPDFIGVAHQVSLSMEILRRHGVWAPGNLPTQDQTALSVSPACLGWRGGLLATLPGKPQAGWYRWRWLNSRGECVADPVPEVIALPAVHAQPLTHQYRGARSFQNCH